MKTKLDYELITEKCPCPDCDNPVLYVTKGLTEHNLPELFIGVALSADIAPHVIDFAIQHLRMGIGATNTIASGNIKFRMDDITDAFTVALSVTSRYDMPTILAAVDSTLPDLKVLQLTFADREGAFPNSAEYDSSELPQLWLGAVGAADAAVQ